MIETWFNFLNLATESQEVIGLRLIKIGQGGTAAHDEACLMVFEKVDAALGAFSSLISGAPADSIVADVRSEVQANAARLARGA